MGKNKIGFFDIDGTLFRSSLMIELLSGLVHSGVFPKEAEREMEEDYLAWLNRKGSYESYIRKVVHIYDRNIAGKSEADVKHAVAQVLESEKDKVYRFTRDLIHSLKEEGASLVAISGSPDFIVEPFSEYMGFDTYYASAFELKDGYFTGAMSDERTLKDKRLLVERFVEDVATTPDLSSSIAVGDSGADIPMLETVGNPIAFNPDHVLATHAQEKGWRIVVERKNVAYEINKCTISGY